MHQTLLADTAAKTLQLGRHRWPMAIGQGGACPARDKREGDGKTPLGRYWLERLYLNAARWDRPLPARHALPMCSVDPQHGWCDAPDHPAYNRRVALPFHASHEALVREDALYDAFIVLSHNRWPAVPRYGSAIFLHIAREEAGSLASTRGCLALKRLDFLQMLDSLTPHSWINIA